MKKYIVVFIGILVFTSCSDSEDSGFDYSPAPSCSISEQSYSNDYGTKLDLTTQDWYLKDFENGGYSIGLNLIGSIVGDKVTIRLYGDGIIYDSDIELEKDKTFNEKATVSFTPTPLRENVTKGYTLITVYNGLDTLNVNLESCALN